MRSFPLTIEDYVHRIGRTGRAGATGFAHTFFCQQDKCVPRRAAPRRTARAARDEMDSEHARLSPRGALRTRRRDETHPLRHPCSDALNALCIAVNIRRMLRAMALTRPVAACRAHAGELANVLREAGHPVPPELLKFGTHVKKKESKLCVGCFAACACTCLSGD